eukprot:GILJ01013310.1.p1 GENE.GILJ01013310.1~~GILJ01013310.1.p1  ORF type:complete len:375 (-),score=23.47 GILJ01013310.1:55-1179(-)
MMLLLIRKRASIRSRAYLVRSSLVSPKMSAWQRLYDNKHDGSFMSTMGLDVRTFELLLSHMRCHVVRRTVGRHPLLDEAAILGLVLHFLNSTMLHKTLCEIFGTPPSTTRENLAQGMKILLQTLRELPSAAVAWPTDMVTLEKYADLIHGRQRSLRPLGYNAIGFMDGLNLPVQNDYKDCLMQNANWNGWLQQSMCSNLLVWSPEGKIIMCRLNGPGSWHDGHMAENVYAALVSLPESYCLVTDTAFKAAKEFKSKILKPLKADALNNVNDERFTAQQMILHSLVLSIRQTAEWGNAALLAMCGRLRLPLHVNPARRAELLEICVLLFNFRTTECEVNQILNTYRDDYSSAFNTSNFYTTPQYDRVSQFYNKVM